ncbi:hypothetical protein AVEN_275772-1 [Araneus ventricosus]|uniref:Uncharacterized protein n=1 Tax=Araneus ventricosus TaxID=182803 RepID=A0A4Y2HEP7_ARAVE|nr:hypothetical protein AVEN_275772-1 [Araneus ventricosus]
MRRRVLTANKVKTSALTIRTGAKFKHLPCQISVVGNQVARAPANVMRREGRATSPPEVNHFFMLMRVFDLLRRSQNIFSPSCFLLSLQKVNFLTKVRQPTSQCAFLEKRPPVLEGEFFANPMRVRTAVVNVLSGD